MIYTVKEGVYFGDLPDRTRADAEGISWGFLFDEKECTVALGSTPFTKKKSTAKQLDEVKVLITGHIKTLLDQYDRMNEIFNLQMSQDNRNRALRADPRRARTFLAGHKGALLPEVFMKIATVDNEFSHVENLLTAEAELFADADLYLLNIKNLSPMICYYVSGVLTTLDRLRMLQENTRRDTEKT